MIRVTQHHFFAFFSLIFFIKIRFVMSRYYSKCRYLYCTWISLNFKARDALVTQGCQVFATNPALLLTLLKTSPKLAYLGLKYSFFLVGSPVQFTFQGLNITLSLQLDIKNCSNSLKGIVHPKIKGMSLITHLLVFPNA